MIDEETPSTATGSSVMHRELSFIQGDLGPPLDESPLLRRVLNQVGWVVCIWCVHMVCIGVDNVLLKGVVGLVVVT